jgi:hypothetical protein
VERTSTIADVSSRKAAPASSSSSRCATSALQRRGRSRDRRVPRHRLPRSQAPDDVEPPPQRAEAGAAGSARSCPTTCCCSAIRR